MFQDEARFGRLPVIRAAWAPAGVRPVVKAAIERQFRYVYGAVSPIEGELDWMGGDSMNTENMSLFLSQIRKAHPDDHILMVVDGASSHKSGQLIVPDAMTLLPLPPYSPELNPVESLWDHVRENACANTYFETLESVLDKAYNELANLAKCPAKVASMFCWPWIIESI
jgi:transposase